MFEESVMRAGEDGEFGDSRNHPADIEVKIFCILQHRAEN